MELFGSWKRRSYQTSRLTSAYIVPYGKVHEATCHGVFRSLVIDFVVFEVLHSIRVKAHDLPRLSKLPSQLARLSILMGLWSLFQALY